MAAQGRTWNDDEVQALLAIWPHTLIQRQLLCVVWNVTVFSNFADKLAKRATSATQSRKKLKQLKKKYKEVVDGLRRL